MVYTGRMVGQFRLFQSLKNGDLEFKSEKIILLFVR
jgi:hypothetical protein